MPDPKLALDSISPERADVPKVTPKPVRLNDFMTVGLAAEFLGVSPSTLRNWDRDGKLRAIRHPVNGYRLYRKADLRRLVEQLQK